MSSMNADTFVSFLLLLNVDVFFFRDGCTVLWDVTPARTRQVLETIQPCQVTIN